MAVCSRFMNDLLSMFGRSQAQEDSLRKRLRLEADGASHMATYPSEPLVNPCGQRTEPLARLWVRFLRRKTLAARIS